MFENVINEVGLAALTEEELEMLLAMLEKAGYQPAPSGAQAAPLPTQLRHIKKIPRNFPNVLPIMYNRTMKKNKKPLNKANEARRKAHSAELFRSLMLSPHLVQTPATRKGSRNANKRKAIAEHEQRVSSIPYNCQYLRKDNYG